MTEAKNQPQDKATEPEEDLDASAPDEAVQEPVDESQTIPCEAAAPEDRDDPVADMEAEISVLKDQLLRAVAETENVRRRAQRDREDAGKYAAVPMIRDLLGVADNLQRALNAVPDDAVKESDQLSNLVTGVQMIEREFFSVLERHKIEKIDPLGEAFDPHSHEAMFELPDPSQPAGTIIQVVQAGYRLHDRLLRPARVGVAKGGPAKAAAGDAEGNGADGNDQPEPGAQVDTKV